MSIDPPQLAAGATLASTNAKRSPGTPARRRSAKSISRASSGLGALLRCSMNQLSISGNSDLCLLLGHRYLFAELSIQAVQIRQVRLQPFGLDGSL